MPKSQEILVDNNIIITGNSYQKNKKINKSKVRESYSCTNCLSLTNGQCRKITLLINITYICILFMLKLEFEHKNKKDHKI